jgi:hypothetical protein
MILPIAFLAFSSLKQTARVSFTCRAEPLSHLVVDLSKATGLSLTTSKECANDVLLVAVQDVPVDRLLAEIAKVDAGEWDKDGAVTRFSSSPAARHEEARAEVARQVKVIKASIQHELAAVLKRESQGSAGGDGDKAESPQDVNQADALKINAVRSGAATEETILKLLENVDPEILILPREGRIVLSTHPTGMQLPLGSAAESAVGELVERRNAVAKILAEAGEKVKTSTAGATAGPTENPRIRPVPGYSKADLVVMDGDLTGAFHVQLTLYTSDGAVALRNGFFDFRPSPPDVAGSDSLTKIEISEAAKAFRKMHQSQDVGDSALVAVPPAVVPFLTDVEHNDPLALTPSDEMLTLAKAEGKPLVAVVPDSAFVDTLPVGQEITLGDFKQWLAAGVTMTMARAGDWVEIKPAYPATARQFRCDRVILGPFLRLCLKQSIPTLDEFAEFTTKSDLANNDVVGAFLFTAVAGFGNSGLGTEITWNLYRIFGEFTPDQRATLLAGGRLPMFVLSPTQLANFTQYGYGATQRLRYGTGPGPMSPNFPSAHPINMSPPRGDSPTGLPAPKGYETEPTELLPNGAQASGYIEMKVAEEPFVSPFGPATTAMVLPRVRGVAQVANQQVRSAEPDFGKDGEIRYTRFKLGSRKLHLLTIHGSDRAYVTGRLYEYHLYQDSPDFAMGSLPAEWNAEVTKRLTEYQEAQAQAVGRKVVPPPSPR